MTKKLGNFFVLTGIISLVVFFSSSAFIVDQGWFLLGGLGFISLGFLLKRREKRNKVRRKRIQRSRERE